MFNISVLDDFHLRFSSMKCSNILLSKETVNGGFTVFHIIYINKHNRTQVLCHHAKIIHSIKFQDLYTAYDDGSHLTWHLSRPSCAQFKKTKGS
jgi:hypothetical protein